MVLIVKKFGGTSLATHEQIERAAARVAQAVRDGHKVVVVTSAMGGVTDKLVSMANACAQGYGAEHDVLLASGEQVSAALMALALQKLGLKSRSWLGWQLPIATTSAYGEAEIQACALDSLCEMMNEGGVSVVAGFQGVSADNRVTTLGRGGSDITALALADGLRARGMEPECHIYTDVDGVYTADPRLVKAAHKISSLSYTQMYQFALRGAEVLHPLSVRYGAKTGVPIHVRSSFQDEEGTWIRANNLPATSYLMARQERWVKISWACSSPTLLHLLDEMVAQDSSQCVIFEDECVCFVRSSLFQAYASLLPTLTPGIKIEHDYACLFVHTKDAYVWREHLPKRIVVVSSKNKRGGFNELFVPIEESVLVMQSIHDVCSF